MRRDDEPHDVCTECGARAAVTYTKPDGSRLSYCIDHAPNLRDRPAGSYCSWFRPSVR